MIFRDHPIAACLRTCALLAVLAGAPTTCMDLTPISGVLRDAGPTDLEAGDCRACMYAMPDGGQPGCGDLVAICDADPQCSAIFACIGDLGCLEVKEPFSQKICGLPCAQEAGIVSADEPKLQMLFAIQDCAHSKCQACSDTEL